MPLDPNDRGRLENQIKEVVEARWISNAQIERIRERLGGPSFEEFAFEALIESKKPSKLCAAADALALTKPAADPAKPGLFLSLDVLRAWGKAQGYLDRLREALGGEAEDYAKAHSKLPKRRRDPVAYAQINNALKQIRAFGERSQECLARYVGHMSVAGLLEQAAQGQFIPLWMVIDGLDLEQPPLGQRDVAKIAHRWAMVESDFQWDAWAKSKLSLMKNAFEQADAIAGLRWPGSPGASLALWSSKLAAVLAPAARVDAYLDIATERGTTPGGEQTLYERVVTALFETKFLDVTHSVRHLELAEFFTLAAQGGKTVRVVINDREMFEGLTGDKPKVPKGETHVAGSVELKVPDHPGPVAIECHYLKPETQDKKPSPMLRLAKQAKKLPQPDSSPAQRLTFGSQVGVTDPRKGGKRWQGRLWGFDPAGNLRIINENGVIGVFYPEKKLWDRDLGKFVGFDIEYIGPPPEEPEAATTLTRSWKSSTVKTADSGFKPTIQAALRDLVDRPVAKEKFPVQGQGRRYSISEYTKKIADLGFPSYIVGGAVRDTLRGRKPNDVDLSTTIPTLDLMQKLADAKLAKERESGSQGDLPVMRKKLPFSILQVEPEYDDGIDIVCLHDVTEYGSSLSLTFDALARDFTFNAVYYDSEEDCLIDPTGHGLEDTHAEKIRFVVATNDNASQAHNQKSLETFLLNDPVNIARWIKFRLKGFTDQETWYLDVIKSCLGQLNNDPAFNENTRYRFTERMGGTPKEVLERAKEWGLIDELKWIQRSTETLGTS